MHKRLCAVCAAGGTAYYFREPLLNLLTSNKEDVTLSLAVSHTIRNQEADQEGMEGGDATCLACSSGCCDVARTSCTNLEAIHRPGLAGLAYGLRL